MPELPEVETVVRGLLPLLAGKRIDSVTVRRPDLRLPLPADLGQRLTGATVTAIRRRAKYGLIDTSRHDTLLFHLGMSGRFRLLAADEAPARHDHVLISCGSQRLALHDPRRFGLLLLVPTSAVATHPLLARIGPEPLEPDFDGAVLAEAAHGRSVSVKALLLDQQVVAGVGNIYACEALFASGIHPLTPASALDDRQCAWLAAAVKEVLARAIVAGGSTLRDHALVSGESGYFQHQFAVYGRTGLPCTTCGTAIVRIVQSGRSSFFCPRCQPQSQPQSQPQCQPQCQPVGRTNLG